MTGKLSSLILNYVQSAVELQNNNCSSSSELTLAAKNKTKNYKEAIALLRKTNLYKAAISFQMPPQQMTLDLMSLLRQSGEDVKRDFKNPSVKIFTEIQTACTGLLNKRTSAYSYMANCRPFGWVVTEENKSIVEEQFAEMEEHFSKIVSIVEENYLIDFEAFLMRIARLGKKFFSSESEVLSMVEIYRKAFPNLHDVIYGFDMTIFYPEKLPTFDDYLDEHQIRQQAMQRQADEEAMQLQQDAYRLAREHQQSENRDHQSPDDHHNDGKEIGPCHRSQSAINGPRSSDNR